MDSQAFAQVRLDGGRFQASSGLPLFSMQELTRYERILRSVARAKYLSDHRFRRRVPKGFSEAIDLRLVRIAEGSVVPVLERASLDDVLFDDLTARYYEQARDLTNQALAAFSEERVVLPDGFPRELVRELSHIGRGLREDESLVIMSPNAPPARVDEQIRRRIHEAADLDAIEVERVVFGQITGLRTEPMRFDLLLPNGRSVPGRYSDAETYDDLRAFLGFGTRAPLAAASVVARENEVGEIVDILDVRGIEAALPVEWRERLDELADMRFGWLNGEGDPPAKGALTRTEDLLLACVDEGIPRPGIFPLIGGGVRLEWPTGTGGIEVDVPNDGDYAVFWYSGADTEATELTYAEDGRDDLLDDLRVRLGA